MRKIKKIILHCSDSEWGTVKDIEKWHLERGWKGCGYHFVICNGYPTYKSYKNKKRNPDMNGRVQMGRLLETIGAHCVGDNRDSIGICLIGVKKFTETQMASLMRLIYKMLLDYKIGLQIFGHYEMESGIKQGKTCPNLDMDEVRLKFIDQLMSVLPSL